MVAFAGRVEAKLTVPSGGASVSATNSGGGPTTCTVPAAPYYLTAAGGVSSLLTALETALNTSRAPSPGSWSVDLDTTTGLVAIDCTSGEILTKTGGVDFTWDAGAYAPESIAGDGHVETTIDETNTFRMIGLATADPGVNQALINYAFYPLATGALYAAELGVEFDLGTTYATGDVLTVKRVGTVITYLKNGTVVRTSSTASTGSLVVAAVFYNASATLKAIRAYSAGVRFALTFAVTNVTKTFSTWSLSWTSTDLRNVLGFTANISNVNAPQTGAAQAKGLWLPDCSLTVEGDPKRAPLVSDAVSSVTATGRVVTHVSNTFRRHRSLTWSHVPIAQVWDAEATYENGSWEEFFTETQLGLGHSWFAPGSPIQIYDHNGIQVGTDASVAGWYIIGLNSIEPRKSIRDWTGLWRIEIPTLVAAGS